MKEFSSKDDEGEKIKKMQRYCEISLVCLYVL